MNGGSVMEFNEKLKDLRSSRGLTQEELAEVLFVSRTAISKWESGRGYPSIDSLKEISTFFSVTIDELLSGEKLISIAKKENKSNIQSLSGILIGFIDLFHFLLIVLPLYPDSMKGYIASVNLLSYTETSIFNRLVYWVLFFLLMLIGATEIIVTQLKIEKVYKMVILFSILLGIAAVLFLALAAETYATALTFLLLVLKVSLYMKGIVGGITNELRSNHKREY